MLYEVITCDGELAEGQPQLPADDPGAQQAGLRLPGHHEHAGVTRLHPGAVSPPENRISTNASGRLNISSALFAFCESPVRIA